MKKIRIALLALLLSVPLLPGAAAFADDLSNTFTISPYVGGILFEGDAHLKTSGLYGFRLGYNITNNIGAEFNFGYSNSGFRSGPWTSGLSGNNLRADVSLYEVNGIYRFDPVLPNFRPYVTAGLGAMNVSRVTPQLLHGEHSHFLLDYGGGAEYFIVPDKIALRGELQHVITINPGLNDLTFTAGLTFFFGKKKEMAPPPPPPPPPPAPKVEAPPPPPPPPAPKKQEAVCIELKVLFDFDKSDVKPEYHDDIKRVADFLNANPTFKGTIEGGTDAVGSEDYNMKLSIRRAEAVKKILVEDYGIAADRLTTVGYGKRMPVDTNLTAEGREQNRRAVRVYCSSGEDMKPPAKPRKCIVLKVDFASNSADVDPEKYSDTFKEIADYMKDHPDFVGTVEGYADASGTGMHNMDLSMKRAENVKKVLVEKYGVPADRLRAEGYGDARPIASNESPEDRAKNRYAVQVVCEPE